MYVVVHSLIIISRLLELGSLFLAKCDPIYQFLLYYQLFQIYKDILINQQTPWVEISGGFETRNQKAVDAIDAVLAR